jgi:uncharacterized membrane protein HdeD (DUF308 family)
MQESDHVEWVRQLLPYLLALLLACYGGIVQHVQRLRKTDKKFIWREFWFDLLISSFAGLLTYFLCDWAEITGTAKAAILIAISGHMGTRAIASFQTLHEKMFGVKGPD